ncbi:hypothetical protein P154DRAFT_533899 [Amniculicola lignicola CBS 123094]|uniref:Uncharacterized protein n=1 Tax=Amniculicola lignicola CBS 123094 TaxID=1392246 RepID=A0A6A5WKP5_9PLEO|nr:hypothetical protein P154DRAFT_533899 [Amniculicola lignicola CBS 123094]
MSSAFQLLVEAFQVLLACASFAFACCLLLSFWFVVCGGLLPPTVPEQDDKLQRLPVTQYIGPVLGSPAPVTSISALKFDNNSRRNPVPTYTPRTIRPTRPFSTPPADTEDGDKLQRLLVTQYIEPVLGSPAPVTSIPAIKFNNNPRRNPVPTYTPWTRRPSRLFPDPPAQIEHKAPMERHPISFLPLPGCRREVVSFLGEKFLLLGEKARPETVSTVPVVPALAPQFEAPPEVLPGMNAPIPAPLLPMPYVADPQVMAQCQELARSADYVRGLGIKCFELFSKQDEGFVQVGQAILEECTRVRSALDQLRPLSTDFQSAIDKWRTVTVDIWYTITCCRSSIQGGLVPVFRSLALGLLEHARAIELALNANDLASLIDASPLAQQQPQVPMPMAQQSQAPLPVAQQPQAPVPVVQQPQAPLPVAQQPQAPVPVVQQPQASQPPAQQPQAPIPVVQQPQASQPPAQQSQAPLPVAQQPEAPLPMAQKRHLPVETEQASQVPQAPQPQAEHAAPANAAMTPQMPAQQPRRPVPRPAGANSGLSFSLSAAVPKPPTANSTLSFDFSTPGPSASSKGSSNPFAVDFDPRDQEAGQEILNACAVENGVPVLDHITLIYANSRVDKNKLKLSKDKNTPVTIRSISLYLHSFAKGVRLAAVLLHKQLLAAESLGKGRKQSLLLEFNEVLNTLYENLTVPRDQYPKDWDSKELCEALTFLREKVLDRHADIKTFQWTFERPCLPMGKVVDGLLRKL